MDRKLNVRSAGLDANLANHGELASRIRWYSLSVSVWAGATVIESPVWTPIGVEVLDGTDDHDVVVGVTHDLHLVLFPADNRLFDQHLGDG